MPEILDLLKSQQSLARQAISFQMRAVADRKGLLFRQEAVSFCLTLLKRRGWASNPNRGIWSISEAGRGVTLHKDQVDGIGRDLWGS